jgi:hypothetical protein
MTDEENEERELDKQSGEELQDREPRSDDPELPAGKLPKGAPTEPGLPPPRD